MLDFVPDYYNDLSVKLRKENARIEGYDVTEIKE